jgi:hypothetical protein
MWCLNLRRGSGRWGAPAASAGGDGIRDGAALSCTQANAREEGVCGARRRGALPGPTGWPAEAHAARCCHGTVAGPALGHGATWSVWGRAPARIVGPRRQRTAESTSAGLGTSRRTDVATSRPERAGALDVL